MSKSFRDWHVDQQLLLPPAVQDFVPEGHLARFVVSLVRDERGLSAIYESYTGEKGQPPYHRRCWCCRRCNSDPVAD
jgi:hypothetical protein